MEIEVTLKSRWFDFIPAIDIRARKASHSRSDSLQRALSSPLHISRSPARAQSLRQTTLSDPLEDAGCLHSAQLFLAFGLIFCWNDWLAAKSTKRVLSS